MDNLRPRDELRASILASIRTEERRKARAYLALSTIALFASLTGLVFSMQYLLQVFYNSEFYSYLALIFSDPDIAYSYWQYVALSLAESLPVFAVIASLIAMGSLLVSVRIMARNIKMAFNPALIT